MIRHTVIVALASAALLAGCVPKGEYFYCPEKVVELDELVTGYNANARRVPQLWARAAITIEADGVAWGSASKKHSNALLLLKKGDSPTAEPNFLVVGRESGVEIFRMGTDAKAGLYYLWLMLGNQGRAYYGQQKFSGAPDVKAMPIDPGQLLEVLGVTELPPLSAKSMPTVMVEMRGKPIPAYVVRYADRQPVTGHVKQWREVSYRWGEKGPGQVFRVRLFDAKGLCRVTAEVDDYEPIKIDGDGPAPMMPTTIRMHWPMIKGVQPASRLTLRLSEMSTTKRFSLKAFGFADHLPAGMPEPVQVDEMYGEVTPEGEPR